MSEALDELRARNRFDVTLPSGIEVTVRPPKQYDYLAVMHDLPIAVLDRAKDVSEDVTAEERVAEAVAATPFEDQVAIARKLDELVNITVIRLKGKWGWGEVTPEDRIADELSEVDCAEIVDYAMRRKVDPKASDPTSSEPSSQPPEPTSTPAPANDTASIQPRSLVTTSSP